MRKQVCRPSSVASGSRSHGIYKISWLGALKPPNPDSEGKVIVTLELLLPTNSQLLFLLAREAGERTADEQADPLLSSPSDLGEDDSYQEEGSDNVASPLLPQCPPLVDTSDPSISSPLLPNSPATPLLSDALLQQSSHSIVNIADSPSWHAGTALDLESGLNCQSCEALGSDPQSHSHLDASCQTSSKLNASLLSLTRPGTPIITLSKVAACIQTPSLSRPSTPLPQYNQDLLSLGTSPTAQLDANDSPLPSFHIVPPEEARQNRARRCALTLPSSNSLLVPLSSGLPSLPTSPFLGLPPHAPTPCNSPLRASYEFLNHVAPPPFKEAALTQVLEDEAKMYRPANTGLRPLLLPKEVAKRNPQEPPVLPVVRRQSFCPKSLVLPQKVARSSVDFDAMARERSQDREPKTSKRMSANVESILCRRPAPMILTESPSLPLIEVSSPPEEHIEEVSIFQDFDILNEQSQLLDVTFQMLEDSIASTSSLDFMGDPRVGLGFEDLPQMHSSVTMLSNP